MRFSIKDFSGKCDQIRSFMVTFTGEILNGKLQFFVQCSINAGNTGLRQVCWKNPWWNTSFFVRWVKDLYLSIITYMRNKSIKTLITFSINVTSIKEGHNANLVPRVILKILHLLLISKKCAGTEVVKMQMAKIMKNI